FLRDRADRVERTRRNLTERAFRLLVGRTHRVDRGRGELAERTFRVAGVALDGLTELLDARIDERGGGLAAHLDLRHGGLDPPDQQLLEAPDAGVEVAGDFTRPSAERAVDVGRLAVERVGERGAARVDRRHGVADAAVDRADHLLAAFREGAGDLHDARAQALVERLGAAVERLLDPGEALIERRGDLAGLAADARVELFEVGAHRLGDLGGLAAKAFDYMIAGGLDPAEALVEHGSDFGGLAADARVEFFQVRAHRFGDFAGLLIEAFDHVIAGGLDPAEPLVERGGDFGALAADARVELLE